ncbi:Heat stress transcription factor A-5 -like protein [Gossypium arboreum]|uniref:Heat stress transcription factor A-5-like protein n=1 Tax=Gossypium arboreum TaxID=29729 RepID=A0A0B0NGH7_GOSAR|nr:Heat stress transcription factor A-5 -like protein [Gossypium arboreum]
MASTVPLTSAAGSGGGGGCGVAPFLLKTYDMVDDSATDDIVSWSSYNKSFVVWNPPEFARLLLPTYFKHNNFSSFIRQLNTYGFRKIDPERWEFANEDFVKGQKHLLKNIHRKKPIHSHSNPQGSFVDPGRAGFEEEIERLSREKTALEANVLRFREERSAAKHQIEELTLRADQMEQRQETLFNFLEKAVQDSAFVEHLVRKIESMESMDVTAYNKKRRLPQIDRIEPVGEICLLDNNNNSSSSRAEFGNIFHQDFSDKLRLELSPAVSDIHLVSQSTQSSDEDGVSPRIRISEGEPKDAYMRSEGLLFAPERLDLSESSRSFTLQQSLNSSDEPDNHISCLLNLTLASSSSQVNRSPSLTMMSQLGQEIGKDPKSRSNANSKDSDTRASGNSRNMIDGEATLSSPKEDLNTNQKPATPPVRVNDVFWERFLTERPDSSDDEESNSDHQANPYKEDDKSSTYGLARNAKNMEQLNL